MTAQPVRSWRQCQSTIVVPGSFNMEVSPMTFILLTSDSVDGYTFLISPDGNGCKLSVRPEYRRNGTQTYDGWFPRYYSKPQYAKAALTRFLGESVNWSPRS